MKTNTFGPVYDEKRDGKRLDYQRERIYKLMKDGIWRTLKEVSAATGVPEASASAQLRHLRKPCFGGYTVERRHRHGLKGTHEYRVLPAVKTNEQLQLI